MNITGTSQNPAKITMMIAELENPPSCQMKYVVPIKEMAAMKPGNSKLCRNSW